MLELPYEFKYNQPRKIFKSHDMTALPPHSVQNKAQIEWFRRVNILIKEIYNILLQFWKLYIVLSFSNIRLTKANLLPLSGIKYPTYFAL